MGIRVKNPLKEGESFTGKVVDVLETSVLLETKDGKSVKLPLPENVLETISDNHTSMLGNDTIKISLKDGEYEVEEVEEKD